MLMVLMTLFWWWWWCCWYSIDDVCSLFSDDYHWSDRAWHSIVLRHSLFFIVLAWWYCPFCCWYITVLVFVDTHLWHWRHSYILPVFLTICSLTVQWLLISDGWYIWPLCRCIAIWKWWACSAICGGCSLSLLHVLGGWKWLEAVLQAFIFILCCCSLCPHFIVTVRYCWCSFDDVVVDAVLGTVFWPIYIDCCSILMCWYRYFLLWYSSHSVTICSYLVIHLEGPILMWPVVIVVDDCSFVDMFILICLSTFIETLSVGILWPLIWHYWYFIIVIDEVMTFPDMRLICWWWRYSIIHYSMMIYAMAAFLMFSKVRIIVCAVMKHCISRLSLLTNVGWSSWR